MKAHISILFPLGIMYCAHHINGLLVEAIFWNIAKNAWCVRLQISKQRKILMPRPYQIRRRRWITTHWTFESTKILIKEMKPYWTSPYVQYLTQGTQWESDLREAEEKLIAYCRQFFILREGELHHIFHNNIIKRCIPRNTCGVTSRASIPKKTNITQLMPLNNSFYKGRIGGPP